MNFKLSNKILIQQLLQQKISNLKTSQYKHANDRNAIISERKNSFVLQQKKKLNKRKRKTKNPKLLLKE